MVKQTNENGQKISDDEDAASILSLAPGVNNLRLQNGLKFDWAKLCLLRQVACDVVKADHQHFE